MLNLKPFYNHAYVVERAILSLCSLDPIGLAINWRDPCSIFRQYREVVNTMETCRSFSPVNQAITNQASNISDERLLLPVIWIMLSQNLSNSKHLREFSLNLVTLISTLFHPLGENHMKRKLVEKLIVSTLTLWSRFACRKFALWPALLSFQSTWYVSTSSHWF